MCIRDRDYPDNKLTGAEFEVYRDTNGNKELDEGDELLGKMEETSTGIYEMTHIEYGGVFVKETKAPEGFLLDEKMCIRDSPQGDLTNCLGWQDQDSLQTTLATVMGKIIRDEPFTTIHL